MAYSFSEAGQDKRAVLVDVVPGRPARLSDVPLRGGRPLEIWQVSSLADAQARAATPRSREPIVEVRADLGRTLGAGDGDAFFALPGVTVLAVRDLFDPHPAELAGRSGDELPEVRVEQLFSELWIKKHGEAPDGETIEELRSALLALGRVGDDPGGAGLGGGA
jgi:exonuclease SbcD